MGVLFRSHRFNINTSVGDQTVTTSAINDQTPVAALFFLFGADTDGTSTNDILYSVGAATASDEQWCCAFRSDGAVGTTDTGRRAMSDECICALNPGDSNVDGEATFKNWTTNGCVITVGDDFSNDFYVIVLFMAGDLDVHADTFTLHATQNNSVDITDPGFELDFMFTAGHGYTFGDDALSTIFCTLGLVLDLTGGLEQYCVALTDLNNQASSAVESFLSTSYGWGLVYGGSIVLAGEFSDIDSDGFTCTTREGAASDSEAVGYLAVSLKGNADFNGGVIDSPTSTGDDDETDPGFRPQAILQILSQMPAVDTDYTDGNAGVVGISLVDEDAQYCGSIAEEDNQGTTDNQSLVDDKAINLPLDTGVTGHEATFQKFLTDGWQLNYTTTQGTAKKWLYVAVESPAAGRLVNSIPLTSLIGGKLTS